MPDKDLEWGCSGNLGPTLGSQLVPGSPSKDRPLWGGEGGPYPTQLNDIESLKNNFPTIKEQKFNDIQGGLQVVVPVPK